MMGARVVRAVAVLLFSVAFGGCQLWFSIFADQRVTAVTAVDPNGVTLWVNTAEYAGDGTIAQWVRRDPDGDLLRTFVPTYDVGGNLVQRSTYDGAGALEASRTWEYDSAGGLSKWSDFDESDILIRYFVAVYNSQGDMVRANRFDPDDSGAGYNTYEYDAAGRRTMLLVFDESQTLQRSFASSYQRNSEIRRDWRNASNGLILSYLFEYEDGSFADRFIPL